MNEWVDYIDHSVSSEYDLVVLAVWDGERGPYYERLSECISAEDIMSYDQVVLITGCSSGGIGFSLCEEFAEQGCRVYATARRIETIKEFKNKDIESRITRRAMDVKNGEDVGTVVAEIIEIEGKIDIVVNNAGIQKFAPVIDLAIADDQDIFETNVISVLRVCKTVVPAMAKRKSGLIINIGSIVGEVAPPWNGVYAASKAALHSITETLSMECRPLNINVMLITTGGVTSKLFKEQSTSFTLPQGSLHTRFHSCIVDVIKQSMGSTIPTDLYAKKVVRKALSKQPSLFVRMGKHTGLFYILSWLPRAWVLNLLWSSLSKSKSKN